MSDSSDGIQRVPAFITVSLALLMMSVDSTIVATVLHDLQTGLNTSINWAGWTLTAYAFGFALMLPVSGALSERLGRRRVFVASILVFTTASLLCGLTDSIEMLILMRALQAAGGAGITPSATGIVVDYFGSSRDRAVSLFGSIFPLGAMIGPVFGGLIVAAWNWRGVFFVNVPIGLLILWMSWRYIPPDPVRPKPAQARLDWLGLVCMGVAILSAMLAVTWLGEPRITLASIQIWLPALIAACSTLLFFWHIGRSARPFIAPKLIYGANFGVVNLINLIYGGIMIGAISLIPFYASRRYALDALQAGTVLVAQGLAAIALSLICTLLIRRTGYRPPMVVGAILMIAGLILLALPPPFGLTPFVWLCATAFLIGTGTGTMNPASRNAGLQLAPNSASTLAALRTLAMQLGTITFISVVTTLLTNTRTPGLIQAWVYVGLAVLLLAVMPLIKWVPEHRGAW